MKKVRKNTETRVKGLKGIEKKSEESTKTVVEATFGWKTGVTRNKERVKFSSSTAWQRGKDDRKMVETGRRKKD